MTKNRNTFSLWTSVLFLKPWNPRNRINTLEIEFNTVRDESLFLSSNAWIFLRSLGWPGLFGRSILGNSPGLFGSFVLGSPPCLKKKKTIKTKKTNNNLQSQSRETLNRYYRLALHQSYRCPLQIVRPVKLTIRTPNLFRWSVFLTLIYSLCKSV